MEYRIKICGDNDFEKIYHIINESAKAYEGLVPIESWKYPYMSRRELRTEIKKGIVFWGYEEHGDLIAVMGIEYEEDVALIRHAYVLTDKRKQGVGSSLLTLLMQQVEKPVLVATWANVLWAISFYKKHGFKLVENKEKEKLIKKYWKVPLHHLENSILLVDKRFSRILQYK